MLLNMQYSFQVLMYVDYFFTFYPSKLCGYIIFEVLMLSDFFMC